MISSLLFVLIGALLVSLALFWGLFVAVVLLRLSDERIVVKDTGPGLRRWPTAELAAYQALLTSAELQRWHNWYLLNAPKVLGGLMAALVVVVAASWLGA